MDLISQFIENYKKKRPSYETASIIAAKQLESVLQVAGVRVMVTSRVKSPGCLESKVPRRNFTHAVPHKGMKKIYKGIADSAGVRVPPYFPDGRDKVNSPVADLLTTLETKQFPEQSRSPSYNKRFSGYWANHYRAQLKAESLDGTQKCYTDARIEIRVASILMHTWSEVEHDLAYKPLQGTLSDEELAIVDELNGLVLTGGIAPERPQSISDGRMKNKSTTPTSQYNLASYLYNYLSNNFRRENVEFCMGNVELLFKLISRLRMSTVKEIEPVLKSVKFEKDNRNISQQITDQIIAGSEKRHQIYQELRIDSDLENEACSQATNNFFSQWVSLERYLNFLTSKNSPETRGALNTGTLKWMNVLDKDYLNKVIPLRKTRNVLICNVEFSEADIISKQATGARNSLIKLDIHQNRLEKGRPPHSATKSTK